MSNPTPLFDLPPEVLFERIFGRLQLRDLFAIARACKHLREAIFHNEFVWRQSLFIDESWSHLPNRLRLLYASRINDHEVERLLGQTLSSLSVSTVRRVVLDHTYITSESVEFILRQCPALQELSVRNLMFLSVKGISAILSRLARERTAAGTPPYRLTQLRVYGASGTQDLTEATISEIHGSLAALTDGTDCVIDLAKCMRCRIATALPGRPDDCTSCGREGLRLCQRCSSRLTCYTCQQPICSTCRGDQAANVRRRRCEGAECMAGTDDGAPFVFCMSCEPVSCSGCGRWECSECCHSEIDKCYGCLKTTHCSSCYDQQWCQHCRKRSKFCVECSPNTLCDFCDQLICDSCQGEGCGF